MCRGLTGAPMFGGSPLSNASAVILCLYSFYAFNNNLLFTTSCSWNFYRRRRAMETLGNMVRFPGEPSASFVPPLPPKVKLKPLPNHGKDKRVATSATLMAGGGFTRELPKVIKIFPEEYRDVESGQHSEQADVDTSWSTNQSAETEPGEHDNVLESVEMLAVRQAAREGATVLIDLKDPASCLCWSLVRRALRKVVRVP